MRRKSEGEGEGEGGGREGPPSLGERCDHDAVTASGVEGGGARGRGSALTHRAGGHTGSQVSTLHRDRLAPRIHCVHFLDELQLMPTRTYRRPEDEPRGAGNGAG